jgi:hypothetical protein
MDLAQYSAIKYMSKSHRGLILLTTKYDSELEKMRKQSVTGLGLNALLKLCDTTEATIMEHRHIKDLALAHEMGIFVRNHFHIS